MVWFWFLISNSSFRWDREKLWVCPKLCLLSDFRSYGPRRCGFVIFYTSSKEKHGKFSEKSANSMRLINAFQSQVLMVKTPAAGKMRKTLRWMLKIFRASKEKVTEMPNFSKLGLKDLSISQSLWLSNAASLAQIKDQNDLIYKVLSVTFHNVKTNGVSRGKGCKAAIWLLSALLHTNRNRSQIVK